MLDGQSKLLGVAWWDLLLLALRGASRRSRAGLGLDRLAALAMQYSYNEGFLTPKTPYGQYGQIGQ